MRRSPAALVLLALLLLAPLALAGCGGNDTPETSVSSTDTTAPAGETTTRTAPEDSTATTASSQPSTSPEGSTTVVIDTSLGAMKVELDAEKAPATVANFLGYVESGFYDGTIFHRVIPGFMIQGGGFTETMEQKSTQTPIENEAANGLKNVRGSISMARTGEVDSATSQFFINVADNPTLDHQDESPQGFGYAVFGQVTAGMDVADRIVAVPTTTAGAFQDVPQTPVVIKSINVQSGS